MVAVHSEVVEVSDQASRERCVLVLDRQVPVAPTPFGDGSIEPPQALAPRLAPHLPASAPRPSPVHREPEKVERARPLPTTLSRLGALERNEPSLLRMQPQSEPLHPLAQHLRYPLRVLAPLESDDKIIALAH